MPGGVDRVLEQHALSLQHLDDGEGDRGAALQVGSPVVHPSKQFQHVASDKSALIRMSGGMSEESSGPPKSATTSGDSSPAVTPLPVMSCTIIMIVTAAEGFTSSVLIPFIGYMVVSFGYPKEDIGYWGGLVTSAYFAAQFFVTPIFGRLADYVGRRPTLMFGLATNAVLSLLFGFSNGIVMAVSIRFITGLCNGSVGIVKAYVREVSDETNQSRIYGLREAGYAIGMMLGGFIGGMLANVPALSFLPPYLPPCIVAAAVNLAGLLLSIPWLKETAPDAKGFKACLRDSFPSFITSIILGDEPNAANNADVSNALISEDIELGPLESHDDADDCIDEDEDECDEESECADAHHFSAQANGSEETHQKAGWKHVLNVKRFPLVDLVFQPGTFPCMMLYALAGFVDIAFLEVFSFWSMQDPNDGGLGFLERQIGFANMAAAVAMCLCQIFVFGRMERWFGTRNLWIIGATCYAVCVGAIPFTNVLAGSTSTYWALWTCLLAGLMFRQINVVFMYASSNIMISNTAPKDKVGVINGISAMFAAASRLAAPIVGGSIFAMTAHSSVGFPIDFHFLFLFLAGLSLIGGLSSIGLKRIIVDNRRESNYKDEEEEWVVM